MDIASLGFSVVSTDWEDENEMGIWQIKTVWSKEGWYTMIYHQDNEGEIYANVTPEHAMVV